MKNYDEAVKAVFCSIAENSEMSDKELFEKLRKINMDTGTFFDLEDLNTFIMFERYGEKYSESKKLSQ